MGGQWSTCLSLDHIDWAGPQLHVSWSVDRYRFSTTLWYSSVDFDELTATHGLAAVERVALHIALFEINKGVSFRPAVLRIAERWHPYLTAELWALWRVVTRKVWAQWRFEHDLHDYDGPELERCPDAAPPRPLALPTAGTASALWFCGGGKDSLLASHLLRGAGEPFDAFVYSHSVYGNAEAQHDLVDPLLVASGALAWHRLAVYDTASDLLLSRIKPYADSRYVLSGETPASVFAAVPIALAHGLSTFLVGHERSANAANLQWDATGEAVNHQWGKSFEAEELLGDYVETRLVEGLRLASVLSPVHDALIFASLRGVAGSLGLAHSCNVRKPWCLRCAKCAYVWICYKAWLPWDAVDAIFGSVNLLDVDANDTWYRQMLGLAGHTPFECIGHVDEVRLAFALARARGLEGRAMRYLDVPALAGIDFAALAHQYLAVDTTASRMPAPLGAGVLEQFAGERSAALRFVDDVLSGVSVSLSRQ